MGAPESASRQDATVEAEDNFDLPALDSTDFNAMMQEIAQDNLAVPGASVVTMMGLADTDAMDLDTNMTPEPQTTPAAPETPETGSSDKDGRIIAEGYPPRETTVPNGASLEEICLRYPNHLIGETLNQFLGIMTAGDIFNLMPQDVQDRSRAKGPKFNLIQKRLTTQRKKLEASGLLNQQYKENYAREKARLYAEQVDDDDNDEENELANKRKKNLAKLEKLIGEGGAAGMPGRSQSRARTEERSSESEEDEPEAYDNHKYDKMEIDGDEEPTSATASEVGEIPEAVHADTLIGVDEPIMPLNPGQGAARQALLAKRANLRNFLDRVNDDENLSPLTNTEVSRQYDQQIQTETLYQFHILLRDVVDIDPRTRDKTNPQKDHICRRMWLDAFGQWAFHFRDGHDQPRTAPMPGLLRFTSVLMYQRQAIEEVHIVASNSLPGGALELLGSRLIRNVLKEQANIVRSFSTTWERMLLDLKKGVQIAGGDQGEQHDKFDIARERRSSDSDQARVAIIRKQLPAFPLLPPTPGFGDPPFEHVEGKNLFEE